MTSDPDAVEVPFEAPEADVLEQYQSPAGPAEDEDRDEDETDGVPAEADPADVADQRKTIGGTDDDDYR
jgi:hypothetical protein